MNIDWGQLVFTLVPVLFGISFIWNRVSKVMAALTELSQVLVTITSALEDKKITSEEAESIKKEALEAVAAFAAIFKK